MKILVIRLSAMGDVALTVPVLKSFSEQNPDVEINLLTNKSFNPFFKDIQNLTLINPDLKGKHKGIFGLFKLFRELQNNYEPNIIIDLHDVLRSKILRFFFRFSGYKNYKIVKDRKDKKDLTKKNKKKFVQLKHTSQRYVDAFKKAGFQIQLNIPENKSQIVSEEGAIKIGLAPFAKHLQKQYPIKKTKELIQLLTEKGYELYIFGGGKQEEKIAKELEVTNKNITSLIGKHSLEMELEFIKTLNLMISMDSSNMHIAALAGIKIVSIWGATHPFAGFTPVIPDYKSFIIQNETLDCRPCSVYGNKKCYKETLECLHSISPETISEKVVQALKE